MRSVIVGAVCLVAGFLVGHFQRESQVYGLIHEMARARNKARQVWLMAEGSRVRHAPNGPPLPEGMPYQGELAKP